MQNQYFGVTGGTVGSRRFAPLAFLLAGILAACGGGSSGPATLKSIAVSPATVTIAAGSTQQLTATGTYSDASTAPITTGITWTSSDSAIVSVDATGKATGVAGTTGTATVTATVGGLSGRSSMTVTAAALQTITVSGTTASPSAAAGFNHQFSA